MTDLRPTWFWMGIEARYGADVATIACTLDERKIAAVLKIRKLIGVIGLDATRQILADALAIEAEGGLLTNDGSRRRTLGGVFFKLAKMRMSEADRLAVFGVRHVQDVATTPPTDDLPPMEWSERGEAIRAALEGAGKVQTVKVALVGRPGNVVEKRGFALLMLVDRGPLPALPKGIPVPDKLPATPYVVYIGEKQWSKVAQSIKNPEDMLIVEGHQFYDKAYGAICVFATSATTKLLKQQQREAQAAAS